VLRTCGCWQLLAGVFHKHEAVWQYKSSTSLASIKCRSNVIWHAYSIYNPINLLCLPEWLAVCMWRHVTDVQVLVICRSLRKQSSCTCCDCLKSDISDNPEPTRWDSGRMLPWKLWAPSVQYDQNDWQRGNFVRYTMPSKCYFPVADLRKIWKQYASKCGYQSLKKRIEKILPITDHLPPKPTFRSVSVVFCYQHTDKLISFWVKITIPSYSPSANDVPLSDDF